MFYKMLRNWVLTKTRNYLKRHERPATSKKRPETTYSKQETTYNEQETTYNEQEMTWNDLQRARNNLKRPTATHREQNRLTFPIIF